MLIQPAVLSRPGKVILTTCKDIGIVDKTIVVAVRRGPITPVVTTLRFIYVKDIATTTRDNRLGSIVDEVIIVDRVAAGIKEVDSIGV